MSIRIGVMSDLHIEIDRKRGVGFVNPPAGHPPVGPDLSPLRDRVDLMVLAGDIDNGTVAVDYADSVARYLGVPVIAVAGNHEFYRHVHGEMLQALRQAAAATEGRVHFLENDRVQLALGGERLTVLGCTLWTDLALYGEGVGEALRQDPALLEIYDYHRIFNQPGSLILPDDPVLWHRQSRAWLAAALPDCDSPTMVVTHHAISERSVAERFRGSQLNAAFVSDLEAIVLAHQPVLWIHGHTHHSVDYRLGGTRVLASQRGYPDELPGRFVPVVVEI